MDTETGELKRGLPKEAALPSVLAIIVNWNGKEHLLECLASIETVDYPGSKLKIVVVDNASSDGSQLAVTSHYSQCVLLENEKNSGYAKAVNQGIQYGLATGAEYLWVFNNDVVILPDTLRALVNAGESDDSILGCSSLIKASVFGRIGLFRTIYNVYFEETDFNVRARRACFRVVIVKKAKVLHKDAATMNRYLLRRGWLLLRNLLLFECLNASLVHLIVFLPYYFLVHVPQFIVHGSYYALRVKGNQAWPVFRDAHLFKRNKKSGVFDA